MTETEENREEEERRKNKVSAEEGKNEREGQIAGGGKYEEDEETNKIETRSIQKEVKRGTREREARRTEETCSFSLRVHEVPAYLNLYLHAEDISMYR